MTPTPWMDLDATPVPCATTDPDVFHPDVNSDRIVYANKASASLVNTGNLDSDLAAAYATAKA